MPRECPSSSRCQVLRIPAPGLWFGVLLAALVSACTSSTTTLFEPTVMKCAATSAPPAGPFAATGGMASLAIVAMPECAWTAAAEASWVTDLAPAAGQGAGQIQFRVAPNPTSSARQADILLNDVAIRVVQQGASCSFTVTPLEQDVTAAGGAVTLAVTTAQGCGWTATSDTDWLAVTGEPSRNGPGTVSVQVTANTGPARSGSVSIAGQEVTINQSVTSAPPLPGSCTYEIGPSALRAFAVGGPDRTSVTTPPGCAWIASSDVSWITVVGVSSGVGSGSLQFVVDSNSGSARVGTLTIAGQVLTLTQDAASTAPSPPPLPPPSPAECTIGVAPTAHSAPTAGATGLIVAVAAPDGCAWTAASSEPWLTVTSGASGSGDGAVTFSVAANPGAQRSATLTIGAALVTVSQTGACTYALSPATTTLGSGGGTGPTITIKTTTSCTWTATTSAPWVTFTSATSGTGDGTVRFSVAANVGPARSGAILIGDAVFTVNQDTGCSSFGIQPDAESFGAAGGTGTPVAVTTAAECGWTATTSDAWITITSGASGIGGGTVTFRVDANPTGTRTGTMAIAGQTFTVSQASGCVFTVAPTLFERDDSAATGLTIGVTAVVGCHWTAVSHDPWITVTAGASGSGSGTVVFDLGRNRGNGRTGTLTVAGTTVTVIQD